MSEQSDNKPTKKELLCILCHKNKPTVPDREQMGRGPIKRVCSECHQDRLRGDALRILRMYDNK